MKERRPPVVATWLMDRFGVTAQNEALTGDLIEEFRSGRSRSWIWTQALISIAMTTAAEFWAHKLLAVRALLVGEVASSILTIVSESTAAAWGPRFHIMSVNWLVYTLATVAVVYAASGWLVGRLHRSHRVVMVLWFAMMTCCLSILWNFHMLGMHFTNSIDSPRFRPYLAFDVTCLAVSSLAVVIGGLAGGDNRRPTSAD